jgi:hypothetical protein
MIMNARLRDALIEAETLPDDRQEALAERLLADIRQIREIDAALAEGERSLREFGPIPAEEVFDRLIKKYGG